jgi:hypothetical protein
MTEATCGAASDVLLDADAAGRLDEGSRTSLHGHLRTCAACRARALERDPSLLFLELGSEPVPPATWDGFQVRLRARLGERASGRSWRAAFPWPRLAWAAPALMAVILGAMLFVVGPGRQRSGDWQRQRAGRPPAVRPGPRAPQAPPGTLPGAASRLPGIAGPDDTRPGGSGTIVPAPGGTGPAGAPLMEGVAAPGARVYRFSVGEPGEETPIYFIVDASIDL